MTETIMNHKHHHHHEPANNINHHRHAYHGGPAIDDHDHGSHHHHADSGHVLYCPADCDDNYWLANNLLGDLDLGAADHDHTEREYLRP